ncbi:erythromycin esterase family protein [Leptolyngbya sp. FACHB-17]|uniref:erythromycin esterase family protein n=1 Tax=unclassified Leptolyngbya TaxID=2650499 RepID=UPI001681902E|nr:erythromycin esterase family protein [Leptolyngbya sp. FACHB-17]MBD2080390.1 erythromycin esterase family protein [Leptolyngbya sp. FACHB-17]
MPNATDTNLVDAVSQAACPLTGTTSDYDSLMDLIGDARLVLIGEATHGTHEFYQQRAEITKRLIQDKGFTAVAVEADFPDAYRVNRYVRGVNLDPTPEAALRGLQQFPTWMWRNVDVVAFVGWLRQHNDALTLSQSKVGFYGLDLYSLYRSIAAVLDYLDRVDPEAAKRARDRYACLDHFAEDAKDYGYAVTFGFGESCQEKVVNQLTELQQQLGYTQQEGQVAADEFFYAEQNARLVKDAEAYYRSMFEGQVSSWNVRDRHMADSLDNLVEYLDRQGNESKVVVWAHNSHLGDARATDMSKAGEWNLGQLVREKYGQDAVLIGFSTYTGTVTAAAHWNELPQLKRVCPSLPGSYEALFHETGLPQFWINLQAENLAVAGLRERRLERAIGVIYRPETERESHYFYASLPQQFDVMIHIDDTRGVEPIDRTVESMTDEVPETFPSAL